jgi:RNA polymerase sigma-70 factor, ECF subfamily
MPNRDFSAVYDDHIWRVYAFFSYRLFDRTQAEDLTQLTFERAFRAWNRYDERRSSVLTWLMAIARNLLIDHLRGDRSSSQRSLEHRDEQLVDRAAEVPDLGLSLDLELALETLSNREREIIGLRFGADLTGPEIADLTGLTLANVQQILSRSLRRMRASMDVAGVIPPGRAHR